MSVRSRATTVTPMPTETLACSDACAQELGALTAEARSAMWDQSDGRTLEEILEHLVTRTAVVVLKHARDGLAELR